jgi:hypothetical protein
MKVHVEHEWMSDGYRVYLYEHHTGGSMVQLFPVDGKTWRQEEIGLGEMLAGPSFTLSRRMMDAFIEATRNIIPASEATQAHLQDAITLRDRLLAMIEKNA